ncbi:hypothetical protein [Roseinatronobacter bogoriensis]|uniref:hypothetical protein n=1 Tax=Roseinatronobacter bogoriensis TaxID=119542 RepID=UPI0010D1916F|nr:MULTISPECIES: hypothetical protein [Rhodobaca]MBB4209429.1 hypothetical protein [Rhodobaca bogoriensis DSM 18756]TDW35206.1 hypothetical protein LY39_03301 [Rhodobaca barguzinensis]TDY66784.1 hypothetical protein EV660_1098 [Rhodobaca bogoriensis DSM 18756]
MDNSAKALTADIKEAAAELGVPEGALRRVAADHGFLLKFGRNHRIARADYEGIISACRDQKKARASHSARTEDFTSETRTAPRLHAAHATAERLKSLSRNTSRNAAGQLVQLQQQK